jgi:acetyl-CoA carboxylase biotin carboxyl carrier protein
LRERLICRYASREINEEHFMPSLPSPIAGVLLRYLVKPGDAITPDTEVALVESMKMHIPVLAERSGRVKALLLGDNASVDEGQTLIELE